MTHSQTDRQQREESRRFAPSLTPNSPLFPGKSRKRRHLSRLAAPSHGRWRRKQAREAPQINREHRRRKRSLTLARPRNLTCRIVPTYASTSVGAALGDGSSDTTMKNDKSVVIQMHATTAGVDLRLSTVCQ